MNATIENIRHELAQLDELTAQLEGERDAIHAKIAADLFAPTKQHEGALAGLAARLTAIPHRRAELEAQLAAAVHIEELAELEAPYREAYAIAERADQFQAQMNALKAEYEALAAQHNHLTLEHLHLTGARAAQMRQRGTSITNEEHSAISERWHFSSPRHPDFAQSMRRRAAAGSLPPGKTLADFGISETEQE